MNKNPQANTPEEEEGQTLLDGVNEVIPDIYEDDIFEQLDDMISKQNLDREERD